MTGSTVVQWLEGAAASRSGPPESITLDNGSEFSGRALEAWAMQRDVRLAFSPPGRPVENGFGESFTARVRDECLNVNWFVSMKDAQDKLCSWKQHYNHSRPHSSIGDRTPSGFAALHLAEPREEERFALSTFDTADGRPCQGYGKLADTAKE